MTFRVWLRQGLVPILSRGTFADLHDSGTPSVHDLGSGVLAVNVEVTAMLDVLLVDRPISQGAVIFWAV